LIVAELTQRELRRLMAGPGVVVRTGPVVARIRSPLEAVVQGVGLHYGQHAVLSDDDFAHFHVSVDRPMGLRQWFRKQVVFHYDGHLPFTPLPGDQGFPLLEWGLNWCMYTLCNQFLTMHSAVLEKGGRAVILPAPSGSGKSTLCAGLAFRGWRLLSDELALLDPGTGLLSPNPRPISLKNRSIEVIRRYAPEAAFGEVVHDTLKGSVGHVRPPADAVAQVAARAQPAWVIFPTYRANAPAVLTPMPRAQAFMKLMGQTFNYAVHGREGFAAMSALIEACDCYEFSYSELDEAVALFDKLAAQRGAENAQHAPSRP
jgi:HprK-related kinase A